MCVLQKTVDCRVCVQGWGARLKCRTYVQVLVATHQYLTQAGRGIPGLRHARTPSHDSPSTRTNISNIVLSPPLTVNPNQIPHCADNVNKFLLP